MTLLQIYAVFGLPIIALLIAGGALLLVRRSAARVVQAEMDVRRPVPLIDPRASS